MPDWLDGSGGTNVASGQLERETCLCGKHPDLPPSSPSRLDPRAPPPLPPILPVSGSLRCLCLMAQDLDEERKPKLLSDLSASLHAIVSAESGGLTAGGPTAAAAQAGGSAASAASAAAALVRMALRVMVELVAGGWVLGGWRGVARGCVGVLSVLRDEPNRPDPSTPPSHTCPCGCRFPPTPGILQALSWLSRALMRGGASARRATRWRRWLGPGCRSLRACWSWVLMARWGRSVEGPCDAFACD